MPYLISLVAFPNPYISIISHNPNSCLPNPTLFNMPRHSKTKHRRRKTPTTDPKHNPKQKQIITSPSKLQQPVSLQSLSAQITHLFFWPQPPNQPNPLSDNILDSELLPFLSHSRLTIRRTSCGLLIPSSPKKQCKEDLLHIKNHIKINQKRTPTLPNGYYSSIFILKLFPKVSTNARFSTSLADDISQDIYKEYIQANPQPSWLLQNILCSCKRAVYSVLEQGRLLEDLDLPRLVTSFQNIELSGNISTHLQKLTNQIARAVMKYSHTTAKLILALRETINWAPYTSEVKMFHYDTPTYKPLYTDKSTVCSPWKKCTLSHSTPLCDNCGWTPHWTKKIAKFGLIIKINKLQLETTDSWALSQASVMSPANPEPPRTSLSPSNYVSSRPKPPTKTLHPH